ncbi:hypothetical protein [Candidatus Methylomirabilis sp.]|uniref:hypothetical protein n=1 Tax=Candidatus Methylomirabilis sp. TaxID=2032687 RepID=UPI0030762419
MPKKQRNVLLYSAKAANRTTVRRQYAAWRKAIGLPDRCDNPSCEFHTAPLIWNGRNLPLILDHKEGNKYDNTPQNLRYLCPNCDAQLETRGGANRGRVTNRTEDGYTISLGGGRKIIAATAKFGPPTEKQIETMKKFVTEEQAQLAAAQQGAPRDVPASGPAALRQDRA